MDLESRGLDASLRILKCDAELFLIAFCSFEFAFSTAFPVTSLPACCTDLEVVQVSGTARLEVRLRRCVQHLHDCGRSIVTARWTCRTCGSSWLNWGRDLEKVIVDTSHSGHKSLSTVCPSVKPMKPDEHPFGALAPRDAHKRGLHRTMTIGL